jgi:hypothetical protein
MTACAPLSHRPAVHLAEPQLIRSAGLLIDDLARILAKGSRRQLQFVATAETAFQNPPVPIRKRHSIHPSPGADQRVAGSGGPSGRPLLKSWRMISVTGWPRFKARRQYASNCFVGSVKQTSVDGRGDQAGAGPVGGVSAMYDMVTLASVF